MHVMTELDWENLHKRVAAGQPVRKLVMLRGDEPSLDPPPRADDGT